MKLMGDDYKLFLKKNGFNKGKPQLKPLKIKHLRQKTNCCLEDIYLN